VPRGPWCSVEHLATADFGVYPSLRLSATLISYPTTSAQMARTVSSESALVPLPSSYRNPWNVVGVRDEVLDDRVGTGAGGPGSDQFGVVGAERVHRLVRCAVPAGRPVDDDGSARVDGCRGGGVDRDRHGRESQRSAGGTGEASGPRIGNSFVVLQG
jgi:hypothetical protein